jgi:hypothetical protein
MHQLEIWQPFLGIEMSPGLADALTECIETWATTQLYSILICKTTDMEHDKKLYDLLASLAFLSPHNLEIPQKFVCFLGFLFLSCLLVTGFGAIESGKRRQKQQLNICSQSQSTRLPCKS